MNPLLEQYLDQTTSPEMKAVFQLADYAFECANSESYEDLIEAKLLADNNGTDPAVLLALSVDHLRDVLLTMGVTLTDDVNAKHGFAALIALIDIEEWDEREPLLAILDQEDEPEETLAQLLGYVSELDTEDFLLVINTVTNSLIDRIREIHTSDTDEIPAELGTLVKARAKLRVLRLLEVQDLIDRDRFNEGLTLGASIETLVKARLELFDELTAEPMAAWLLGLALASNLEDEAVLPAARLFVEQLTSDARKMTAIDVALSNLMSKVTHA